MPGFATGLYVAVMEVAVTRISLLMEGRCRETLAGLSLMVATGLAAYVMNSLVPVFSIELGSVFAGSALAFVIGYVMNSVPRKMKERTEKETQSVEV